MIAEGADASGDEPPMSSSSHLVSAGRLVLTLGIATAGGFLLWLAHMPLAWLSGAMNATAFCAFACFRRIAALDPATAYFSAMPANTHWHWGGIMLFPRECPRWKRR